MRKLFFLCLVYSIFFSSIGSLQAADKVAHLSMVYSNSLGKELPYSLFSQGKWKANAEDKFVKLHLYFDHPFEVGEVELTACNDKLRTVDLYFNFNELYLPGRTFKNKKLNLKTYVNTSHPEYDTEMPPGHWDDQGGPPAYLATPLRIQLRSLIINFGQTKKVELCGISFKDSKGKKYKLQVPKIIEGKVSASSTLSPMEAYAPIFMFDSRYEYAWSSNGKNKNVDLDFKFQEEQEITALQIWNGYQRSEKHCFTNTRPKELLITGSGGYKAKVKLRDIMGSQVIKLPKAFKGKELKIKLLNSYKGKWYKDMLISELRFLNSKGSFLLNSFSKMKKIQKENQKKFNTAGLLKVLNNSITSTTKNDYSYSFSGIKLDEKHPMYPSKIDDPKNIEVYARYTLRLRSDGSLYLGSHILHKHIHADAGSAIQVTMLGNYQIRSVDKNGIHLKIFGLYYKHAPTHFGGDCNGCGRDCSLKNPKKGEQIFQEFITLRSGKKKGTIFINTTKKPKRLLIKSVPFHF